MMRKFFRFNIKAFFVSVILITPSLFATADENSAREYKIKAAYLYNLIKFIHWPKSNTPYTATHICILGNSPFEPQLLDKLSTRRAKGLPITVNNHSTTSELRKNCHIIFVSHLPNDKPLAEISDKPVLLVGENEQFLDKGGLVSLVVINNNVQLHINLSKAKEVGFEISGNLLEIAKVVK